MKKRIALAAAIALAISVSGMLPASATKLGLPTVASGGDLCSRAGDTLQMSTDDDTNSPVLIGRDGTDLTVSGIDCSAVDLALLGLTKVIVKGNDQTPDDQINVEFDLEGNYIAAGRLANYSALTFTVQTDGYIEFDGSGVTTPSTVSGIVTEEGFTVGTLKGSYFAADEIVFAGGTGNDSFDASAVATTVINADGDVGNDTLKGGALDDNLEAGDGTPTGNDKLYGGAGDDTLDVDDNGVCDPTDALTDTGVDQAWGGSGADDITVDSCDTVAPGDGEDTVTGAPFAVTYVDSSAAISFDMDTESGIVASAAGDDYVDLAGTIRIYGSSLADTMIGLDDDTVAEWFSGGAGADTLIGLDGDDTLNGGGGKDLIKGGVGADTLNGDSGADKLFGGAGADSLNGGGGDDVLYGSNDDDILRGDKGSDQAWGGKGTFDVCAAEVTDSCEFKK